MNDPEQTSGPVGTDGTAPETLPPPPAQEEKTPLLAEIRSTLNLEEDAEDNEILLALKNLAERAEAAEKANGELASVRAELESARMKETERRLNDLLDQGVREGKITPSTRAWWAKLSPEQLEKHLPDAPVIVPQGTAVRETLRQSGGPDSLTDEDQAVCRRFGIPEEKFLEAKKRIKR